MYSHILYLNIIMKKKKTNTRKLQGRTECSEESMNLNPSQVGLVSH